MMAVFFIPPPPLWVRNIENEHCQQHGSKKTYLNNKHAKNCVYFVEHVPLSYPVAILALLGCVDCVI